MEILIIGLKILIIWLTVLTLILVFFKGANMDEKEEDEWNGR